MLLYHFPLTTELKNKGFATLYKDSALTKPTNELSSNNALLVNGGQISQKAKGQGNVIGNLYMKSISTFSIAFRFKADTSYNSITRFLVLNINSTGTVRQIFLQRGNDGTIQVCYYNGSSYPAPYKVTADNMWHSWVVNCDNGNMTFYVDNTYLGSLTADFTTRDYVSFGANGWIATASQDGSLMQDFRMWDTILSQAEINEYSRALVVHYPLQGNELNPSVLKDVSGFGNDYTLQGTNSYQLDSARGLKSLHTTDTAIYTQTPISSGYTTSFWCKYNGEWKHLCNNGSKYVNGVVNSSLYDTIYATLTASGYDIVDYRVYATALSAEDIKNLYNSPIALDNKHNTMAFEFVEGNDGFSANKNGIVQHNELRENDSDVNGCYNNKLITNELIEN